MGFKDLQLDKKDRVSGRWTRVKVDFELPPIELNKLVEKEDLGSPPPGRPDQARHGKRDRESSGSTGNSNLCTGLTLQGCYSVTLDAPIVY